MLLTKPQVEALLRVAVGGAGVDRVERVRLKGTHVTPLTQVAIFCRCLVCVCVCVRVCVRVVCFSCVFVCVRACSHVYVQTCLMKLLMLVVFTFFVDKYMTHTYI
jgi:hypothetical protein